MDGAARAAGQALHQLGYHVIIAGRSLEKAERLAGEVHGKGVDWAARHGSDAAIVVNCTPVGMHPEVDDSPLHAGYLKPDQLVFDTVYRPERTMLVADARERECKVLTGVDLFVRQAAMQFELFTGRQAPIDLMYETVRQALSPVTKKPEAES